MTFQIELGVERPRGPINERAKAIEALASAAVNASVFFPLTDTHKSIQSMQGSIISTVLKHGAGWASVYRDKDGVRVFKNAEPKRYIPARLAA